jgi:hypothetical protein
MPVHWVPLIWWVASSGSVIPAISDKQHKRQRFMFLGIALAIPDCWIDLPLPSTWVLFRFGFFYGVFPGERESDRYGSICTTEVTYPTPEGI